jgi:hypothetical protein
MTVSIAAQSGAVGGSLATVVQPAAVIGVAAVSQGVVGNPGTLYAVDVDNTNNSADTYVKIYDSLLAVVGTDDPWWIFMTLAATRTSFTITTGTAFDTALRVVAVTEGGTGGNTGAAAETTIRILYTETP